MTTRRGWWFFAACMAAWTLALPAHARDKEKRRLFNTFYFEGEGGVWSLEISLERVYRLVSPDGQLLKGKATYSEDQLALAVPEGRRHFDFRFEGDNVWLTPSKKDETLAAGLLSRLPPLRKGEKVLLVSRDDWKAKGKPEPPAPKDESEPAAPDATLPAVPPSAPGPSSLSGHFRHTMAGGQAHELKLASNGTFEYAAPSGQRARGTFVFVRGELTLDSGFHRRQLSVQLQGEELQFWRRETDILKLGDPLGEMPPQDRAALVYKKVGGAPALEPLPAKTPGAEPVTPVAPVNPDAPATAPVEPAAPEPAPTPVPPPEPAPVAKTEVPPEPEPVKPPPPPATPAPKVAQPAPAAPPPTPTPAPAGVLAVASIEALAGSYRYRPNPLVTERFTVKADGGFLYRDSNGAEAAGTLVFEGEVLKMQSGEVVRLLTATLEEGKFLVLKRTEKDRPKILNDLATMSPSVLESARYEKLP
ncbi:MAG: hypothetical protein AMXMBFR7_35640 [Planctomycetota bacterium]